MSIAEKETWGAYSKLVLKELERLNEDHDEMKAEFENRFKEINGILSDLKNTERLAADHKVWIEKVNDVWSPVQMKEAKDEIYAQKNKWIAALAIIAFVQLIFGIAVVYWAKSH